MAIFGVLGLSTRYNRFFCEGGGDTPTFGPRVEGTPKIAVERKMEQGFHSGAEDCLLVAFPN